MSRTGTDVKENSNWQGEKVRSSSPKLASVKQKLELAVQHKPIKWCLLAFLCIEDAFLGPRPTARAYKEPVMGCFAGLECVESSVLLAIFAGEGRKSCTICAKVSKFLGRQSKYPLFSPQVSSPSSIMS